MVKRNSTSLGCKDLALPVYGLCKHMRVNQDSLSGVGLIQSAGTFIMAKLKVSQANSVPF